MSNMYDETDLKIIQMLKRDSRINRQVIAENLDNITRQTVHNRIKALEEKGIILKYTILTNDKKLGKEVTAVILVILDRAASVWEFTAKELWKQQQELGIIEMHHLAGEYDVMLKLKTESIEKLEKILAIITTIKGVQRTHTMVCLSSFEQGFVL